MARWGHHEESSLKTYMVCILSVHLAWADMTHMACRIYTFSGYDPAEAVLDSPQSGALVSAAALYLSQRPTIDILTVLRSPLLDVGLSYDYDDNIGGAQRRGVEYRVEPRRRISCEREQGQNRDHMA